MWSFARTLVIRAVSLAISLAAGCGSPEPEPTASVQQAIWSNGDFESDAIGTAPPTGWSVTTYQNAGISGTSTVPPSSFSALNLSSSTGTGKAETFVVGGTTLGQADPDLGSGQSFRYPLFGARAVRVNYKDATDSGKNKNANSLQQTMTVSASDVDPTDGQVHVRFAVAPVLENPSHGYTQQPYYYVELVNVTRGTTIYHDFNVAGQSGVPWNTTTSAVTGNATQWLNWQLVDIAPGPAAIATGDQVKLTVVGSGCSLGGHFGRIYLDGIGPTVPGLYTWATAPQSATAGSNLTYTFFYSNGGTSSGIGTHVDFVTPPQTSFVSASLGASCTAPAVGATGTVSCPLGTLGAGAAGTFTITVKIGATATGSIVNGNYSISAVNATTLLGAKVTTTIPGSTASFADVSVTQSANRTVASFGQSIQYTFKVANAGPTAISTGGLTVTDTMPAQLTGATWSCTRSAGNNGSTRCGTASGSGNISVRPKIGSGGELTYTVSGTIVSGSGLGSITHTVTAGAQTTTTDPDPTNNTAVLTIPIGTSRTLSLTKSGGASNGTVSSSPSGISCGSACSSTTGNFADSSSVVLTATPIGGASFTSWSGACTGSARTCTITMSGNQSATATFTAAPAAGAAAIVYPYAGGGQLAPTSTAFTTSLAALVTDASGNVLSGVTVTFGGPGSGAGASFTSVTTTNAAGIATATTTANATAGSYTATASVQNVATPASFSLTNVGPATHLVYLTGGNASDPQLAPTGGVFSSGLVAIAKDAAGNPVPGATVTYAAPSSGASATLTATSVTSDANGLVQVGATANSVVGSYTVTATLAGATPVAFDLQNLSPAPATVIVVSGSNQSADLSTAFASPLSVVVADALGNALPNVTVAFAAPSSGAAATLDRTQVTTDSLGQASVNATANATAGTYTVSATVSGVAPASFTLVNNGTQFIDVLSGSPQHATVGASFGAALVAVLTDINGSAVSGVTVTFTAPASGAKASLSASTAVTDSSGLASITATAGTVAGDYTVTASVPLAGGLASFALTNDSGPAASISAASGGGQTATAGAVFAAPLVAQVADASGNPVAGVTVTFAAPSSGATASLDSATAVTDSSGLARVTPTAGTVAGSYSVSASVTGIGGTASFSLTNLAGAAAAIAVISGSPQSATVGAAFAPIVAKVTDSHGNPVSGVTVSFTAPSTGATATVAATATTNGAGLASATPTAGTVAGAYVIAASVGGVIGSADFSLTNLAGAAAAIAVDSGSPQSTTVGAAFAPIVAKVTDSHGNPVSGTTVSFTAPSTGATATVAATATTNGAGLASATPTAGTVAGAYVIAASVGGVIGSADFSLTNLAGAAAAIAVDSGSPQSATVGAAFAPIVAKVTDSHGNPVSGATVSFTAPSSGASATVAGTASTSATGLASVTPTAGSVPGSYVVSASVGGVTGSADFSLTNLAASAVAAIAVDSGSPQGATVGTAFSPIVAKVTDGNGSGVAGVTVSFTAPSTGATATVLATATTDSAGLASATPVAGTIAGAYVISATTSGVTGSADFSLTNLAGAAAAIAVDSGSPQSVTVGAAFAAVVAKVTDSHGNPVSGTAVSFTAPSTGATATVAASATTNSAGLASATPTAGTVAGAYTLSATASGVTGSADFSLTNLPGPAAAIAVDSGSPQSITVGAAFAAVVAKVTDSHGNPVSGATVSFIAPSTGATATVAATATTNSAGLASATPVAGTIAGAYVISATTSGVTGSADFSLTNLAGAAAAIAVDSGSPQSVTVGAAFAAVVAKVTDSHGNPVSGATVSFTAPSTGATATVAASATTNSAGLASATPTAGTVAGAYTLSATAGGVTGSADFSLTNLAGAAAEIAVNSGSPQSVTVGAAFAAVVAKVTDSHGNPVSGAAVSFTAPSTGATATVAASATTNGAGLASATPTAGTIAGAYTLSATAGGVTGSADFSLTNLTGAAAVIAVDSGSPQSVTVGAAFAAVVAKVTDSHGNPVSGAAVSFTAPSTGATATVAATATTNSAGLASATPTAGTVAGAYTLSAATTGVTGSADFSLTNLAGAAAEISVDSGSPQSATVGATFAAIVAKVTDSHGNPVSGAAVSFTAPSTGATATVAATATTNSAGLASATPTAGTVAGAYTLSAATTGVTGSADFSLTNLPGAAAEISVDSGSPQSVTVGATFAATVAKVTDSHGNPVSGATVSFTAPSTGATATVAATATTNSAGLASAVPTAGTVAGAYTLSATASGVTGSADFSLTNLPGPAAEIAVDSGSPQSVTVGAAFAAVVAKVTDSHGNPVSGATVSFTAPSTGATASIAATATTNSAGLASATPTAGTIAGAYTLSAAASGVTGSADFSLTNLPGPAAAIAVDSGSPQSVTVGTAFAAIVAKVTDSHGNPVSGTTVSFTAPSTGATATVAATATTNGAGLASATPTAGTIAGAYTLSATASGVTGSADFSLTNLPGAAAAIAVDSGSPQSATVGAAFAAVVAKVTDSHGNPVSGTAVSFTAPSTGATATVAASATTNSAGLASATPTAGTVAGAYTLSATASGVTGSADFSLTNLPGPAAAIAVDSGSPQSATVGAAFAAVVAKVTDSHGNPVSGTAVSFTAPSTGATATVAATATTNSAGLASATPTAGTVAGAYTLSAAASGVTGSADFSLTNLPGPAAAIAVDSGSPQSVTVGTAFAAVVAKVTDSHGNPVSGAAVSFTAPSTGATATVAASATTNGVGLASATPTAGTVAGAYTLSATASGVTGSADFLLTNTPGAVAALTATGGDGQEAAVLVDFAAPLAVHAADPFGNAVPGARVRFSSPISGANATFPGDATTDQHGDAQIVATAGSVTGAYLAQAASGSAPPVSFALTNLPGAAAQIAVVDGTPQRTTVAIAFAAPLRVVVKDAQGNVVPAATVAFSAQASSASAVLGAPSAATGPDGIAQVTASANTVAGDHDVTASLATGASCAFHLTNTAGIPASVTAAANATPQQMTVALPYAEPLAVTVRDRYGNPVPGVTVGYTAPGDGPSAALSATTATTDASGSAAVDATANQLVGSFIVRAAVDGVADAAAFVLGNIAGSPETLMIVEGDPQSATVDTDLAPLVVQVFDAFDNPVPAAIVSFVASPGGPGGATAVLTSGSAQSDAAGLATMTVHAGTIAGAYTITASLPAAASPVSFALTNTPGAAATITAAPSSTPQNAQVDHPFTRPLVAQVLDGFANPVPGVTVTFAAPATLATGALATTTATTTSDGRVSTTITAGTVAGTYAVTATANAVATPASFALTNLAGEAHTITASAGAGQSATVATGFAAPIVALVQDAHGNAVPDATVVFTAPTSGATASPDHAEVTTGADGTARTALTCAHVAGAFAIIATTGSAAVPAEFALSALPGSPATASALSSATPQATEVGQPFAHPLALAIADAYGNPVPGAHIAFAAPDAPGAQLSANTATSDAGGIASVLAIADSTAGGYRVTASVTGTIDVAFELTNAAAAPSVVLITGGGAQRALATTAFATPVTARVVDSFGNSIAGAAVGFTTPTTGATATIANPTPVSDARGGVSVALTAGPVVGRFILSAQVAGAAAPMTTELEVTAIPTTITASAPASAPVNDDTSVAITVSAAIGTPGGTVDVLAADGTRLASAALDHGSATLAVAGLTLGSHTVTASYAAQGSYGPSVSATVSFELTGDTGKLSGGGCSATGSGGSLIGLSLAGLVALAIRRRRRPAGLLGLAAIIAAGAAGATAWADPSARAIDRYRAASPDSAWFALDSAAFAGEREVAIALVNDYARDPLDVYDADTVRARVVRNALVGQLGGSVTVRDRVRLSATVVMATWQNGTGGVYNGVHLPAPTFAFGDVTLAGDVRVVGTPRSGLRIAVGLRLTTPTGQRTSYMSDATFAGEPRVLVAGSLGAFEYAGGASAFLRRETMFAGSSFGSELRYGAAFGERLLGGKLLVGPELFGAASLDGHAAVGMPLELQLGGHYAASEHLRVGVGAGLGLDNAVGEPHWRALVALHWTP